MIRRCVLIILVLASICAIYLQIISHRSVSRNTVHQVHDELFVEWYESKLKWLPVIYDDRGPDPLPGWHFDLFGQRRLFAAVSDGEIAAALVLFDSQGSPPTKRMPLFGPVRYQLDEFSNQDELRNWYVQNQSPAPMPLTWRGRTHTVIAPLWMLIVLFAALPVLTLVRRTLRRSYRRNHGLCMSCGYDLVGTDAERCPECGSKFDAHRRARTIARYQRRVVIATRWADIYRTRRIRRYGARCCVAASLTMLALWPVSYFRPAFRTPWFNCRIAWGNVAIFGDADRVADSKPRFAASIDGYFSMETWWWPFDIDDWRRGWIFLPFWLIACVCLAGWFVAYRPDLRRRSRHARALADAPGADDAFPNGPALGVADAPSYRSGGDQHQCGGLPDAIMQKPIGN